MQKALATLPGVRKDVDVNIETETATLYVERSSKEDDSRFIKAIEKAGFQAKISKRGTE